MVGTVKRKRGRPKQAPRMARVLTMTPAAWGVIMDEPSSCIDDRGTGWSRGLTMILADYAVLKVEAETAFRDTFDRAESQLISIALIGCTGTRADLKERLWSSGCLSDNLRAKLDSLSPLAQVGLHIMARRANSGREA